MVRRVELPPFTFWETRSGSGPPVVLIHGLGGSSEWWRYTMPALAATHTVAAVDLVGFGRNRLFLRRSSLPLKFDDIGALLIRWLESSFDQPVHLVGNSMGGHIAIHVAAARPDLVRSLVLVDSTGIPFELKPGQHLSNLVVPPGAVSFARILARDLFRSGPASIGLAFARLLRDDARPSMRVLRMPVLLLWGERDPLVPLAYAREIQAEVPQARLVVIARAGHVPMWDHPAAFNAALTAFLQEVEARADGPSLSAGDVPSGTATVERSGDGFSWGLSGWSEGIAHREAGAARDFVLIHGLGMSSSYFGRLARELFERGVSPTAPDLPGFGESIDGQPGGPEAHAEILAAWADRLQIRDARWAGHSTGCHAVAHLALRRPDLVREVFFLSPLWSESRHPARRLAVDLLADTWREPLALYPRVLRDYWRSGLWRWWRTFRLHWPDFRSFVAPSRPFHMLAGADDPLVDHVTTRKLCAGARLDLPGAHAMHFSHPGETAEALLSMVVSSS
jgi:pimeloyl-ACP methyl ester carboxylesterase